MFENNDCFDENGSVCSRHVNFAFNRRVVAMEQLKRVTNYRFIELLNIALTGIPGSPGNPGAPYFPWSP